jgi:hypothetical protein
LFNGITIVLQLYNCSPILLLLYSITIAVHF